MPQKAIVQGKPCAGYGTFTTNQFADHIDPFCVQYYCIGEVDLVAQSRASAFERHSPECSAAQGGYLSAFVKRMRKRIGWD